MRGRGKGKNNNNNLMRARSMPLLDPTANSKLARQKLEALWQDGRSDDYFRLMYEAEEASKVGGLAEKSTLNIESYRAALVEFISEQREAVLADTERRFYFVQSLVKESATPFMFERGPRQQVKLNIWNESMLGKLKTIKPLEDNKLWWAAFLTQMGVEQYSSLASSLLKKVDESGNVIIEGRGEYSWSVYDQEMADLLTARLVKEPTLTNRHNRNLFNEALRNLRTGDLLSIMKAPDQKVGVLKAISKLPVSTARSFEELKLNEVGTALFKHPKFSSHATGKLLEDMHYTTGRRDASGVLLSISAISKRPELLKQKTNMYHAIETFLRSSNKLLTQDSTAYQLDEVLANKDAKYKLVMQTLKDLVNTPQWSDRNLTRVANQAKELMPDEPTMILNYLARHPKTSDARKVKLQAMIRRLSK